jgi:hypothetical protein
MYLQFRRRNGTYAVPTAIANGDRLGSISWVGQWGTTVGNLSVEDANFFSAAAENFTSTARGTSFQFETTTIGTTTLASRLTLSSGSATFSVPVITSSNFQISAAAGTTRDFFWRTSGSTRFTASINAVAESGSNAGSNFELRRYSDAGADLGLVMDVTRSSGNIAFNTGGGISTFANDIVAPYVQVSRPAGSAKPILYRTGSTTRWTMQATSGAESGGNVGADWALDAHVDAGGYNFTALAISRSSGNAVFYNLVTAPQLRVSTSNAPASATATGASGMIRWDANYIYVCTATDTWKRVAIATWP